MKKLMKRLRAKSGETLVETLAAVLIFTLSSILLLTMASSASRINQTVKDSQQRNQEQMVYAEQGADAAGAAATGKTVTITLDDGTLLTTVAVDVYQKPGDANAFYSYFKHEEP